jgi:hypothetical protein
VTLSDGREVQTWPLYPYRIYYWVRGDTVEILRIYHQARRPLEP